MNWVDLKLNIRKNNFRPHQAADRTLSKFNIDIYNLQFPFPIRDILSDLAVPIKAVSNPGWLGACQSNEKDAFIWYDIDLSEKQIRFVLAHMLGCLLTQKTGYIFRSGVEQFSGFMFEGNKDMSKEFRESNVFAERLLMPFWVICLLVRSGYTSKQLADYFQVTQTNIHNCLNSMMGY